MTDTLGVKRFRANQVFQWMHRHRARSFEAMTNLPGALRDTLTNQHVLRSLSLKDVRVAKDGTQKLLLETVDGHAIESVIIPMNGRLTQCVSSQVGCKIGCDFCLTGRMTTRKNLTAARPLRKTLYDFGFGWR